MKPTVNNPIEGMIEVCARYTKTIGGKRNLVYFETIASQVKMADGRTAEDRLSQVDEYFRLANEYVAGLAEEARNSKDAAHASEVAAAASQAQAELEAIKAQAQAQAAAEDAAKAHADRLYVDGIAADVEGAVRDVAIEILAPEILDRASDLITPRVIEAVKPEVREWLDEEVEVIDARLDTFDDRLTELTLSTAIRDEHLTLASQKQTIQLAQLQTRFDDKQIADVEHFSNLSYASVVHTREILELTERETASVVTHFLVMARMALCHMKDIVWGVQEYLRSIATATEIVRLVDGEGSEIDSNDITFVSSDGQTWTLADLTVNHR